MVGNGTSGGGVRLDVRLPIGALFSVLGVLLAAYGAATRGRPGTAPTGVPIDLVWGLVLLAFGALMLALARRGMRGREGGGGPAWHRARGRGVYSVSWPRGGFGCGRRDCCRCSLSLPAS